jgi:hypothetical protein
MNTTTNPNPTVECPVQRRVMRTYEVALVRHGETQPCAADVVNLSYELDAEGNALSLDGRTVEPYSITARIELAKRLRKLAETGDTEATTDQLDDEELVPQVRLVASRMVAVPVNPETGRPIPRRGR